MNNKNQPKLLFSITILIFTSLACSVLSSSNDANNPSEGNTNTSNTDVSLNSSTEIPEPSESTAEPTESSHTPTPTVAHVEIPGDPPWAQYYILDLSSKYLAAERRADLDYYQFLVLERPFTADVMDYIDYIDLNRAEIYVSYPWMYFTLFIEGIPPADSEAVYGVEIDLDMDGRGDWLVIGQVPSDSNWTSEGVYVYQDKNNDIGGPSPMYIDGVLPNIDGYENLFFDQGYGSNDPDTAWIRRDPDSPQQIQFAVKTGMVGDDNEFLWGVWAHQEMPDPALYDFHDKFTLADAGSPLKANAEYPLKEIAAVDNTCRWSYGFDPVNNMPGLCYLPPTPTPTPMPGSISGGVWNDPNNNQIFDSGEFGFQDVAINLGSGACGSTPNLASTTTLSDGSFTFANLQAGTYCVSSYMPSGCGNYIASTVTERTIILLPGENANILWFGYWIYIC